MAWKLNVNFSPFCGKLHSNWNIFLLKRKLGQKQIVPLQPESRERQKKILSPTFHPSLQNTYTVVLKSLTLLQSKENCSRIASFPEIKQIDQIAAERGTPLHWVSIGKIIQHYFGQKKSARKCWRKIKRGNFEQRLAARICMQWMWSLVEWPIYSLPGLNNIYIHPPHFLFSLWRLDFSRLLSK